MITPADTPPAAPEQMPVSGFDIQAPYAPGAPQPIAGAVDEVAGDVAAAQATAAVRQAAYQAQTYEQGSQIGDPVTLPPQDFSVTTAHETSYTGQGGPQ